MFRLVTAEKLSIVQSIAKVLIVTGRKDSYLEVNSYIDLFFNYLPIDWLYRRNGQRKVIVWNG